MMTDEKEWRQFYEKEADLLHLEPSSDEFCIHRCKAAWTVFPGANVDSLLDVGCGDGFFCGWVRQKQDFGRVVGTDVSVKRVDRARQLHAGVEFKVAALPDLPFNQNEFDTVSLIEVLEHLREPVEALVELARVANRNVIVTVPDRREPQVVACPHCLETFHVSGHLHYFDPVRLRGMAEEAGMIVEEMRVYWTYPYAHIPRPVRWIAKTRDWCKHALRPMSRGKFLACRARVRT